MRAQQHVDHENSAGAKQTLIISEWTAGKKAATLTVTLDITNYDEQAMSTQTAMSAPVWYLSKGDSRTVLISGQFRDPEGTPVGFDSMPTSSDVWVCDNNLAGDSTISSTAPTNANTLAAGAPGAAFADTGDNGEACTVSNTSTAAQRAALTDFTAPDPGFKGGGGNRVVTTRKVGPILHITADSLVTAPDATTAPTDRPKGTYSAVVYYRIWFGPEAKCPRTGRRLRFT